MPQSKSSPAPVAAAKKRRLLKAILLVIATLGVGYLCFGDLNWRGNDWVPGTTRTWDLPDSMRYATRITCVDGLDQPLIGGDGMIMTPDRQTFRRGVRRFDVAYQHNGNLPGEIAGTPERLRVQFYDRGVAVLSPDEPMRPHIPGHGTIDPRRWGVSEQYGLVWPQHGGPPYRFDIQTGEIEPEPMDYPSESNLVYKFGKSDWLAVETDDRMITLRHSSDVAYFLEGTHPVVYITARGEVVVIFKHVQPTLHHLKLRDGHWDQVSEPLPLGSAKARVPAIEPERHRLLVSQDRHFFTTGALFRPKAQGDGALLLFDYAQNRLIARHDVAIQSPAGQIPSNPWFRATFSPNGERLFIVTTEQRCLEIDVQSWITSKTHE